MITERKEIRLIIGLVFLLACIYGLYIYDIKPRLMNVQNWEKISCTIISSEVEDFSDSEGRYYHAKIVYSYNFKGLQYTSGNYDFASKSKSSSRDTINGIVSSYPGGSKAFCYVNPDNPKDSALKIYIPNNISAIIMVFLIIWSLLIILGILKEKKVTE